MKGMNFLEELEVKDRRVFLRVDFNVPLTEAGEIRDDTRIRATLPTIRYLLDNGARLIVASHLGRPKGKKDPKLSLAPVAQRLSGLVPNKVIMSPSIVRHVRRISCPKSTTVTPQSRWGTAK